MPRATHDRLCITIAATEGHEHYCPGQTSCWCKCLNCWDPFTSRCVCRSCPCVRQAAVWAVSPELAELRSKAEFSEQRAERVRHSSSYSRTARSADPFSIRPARTRTGVETHVV